MIDQACKNGRHDLCRGGTWCDCQHKASDSTLRGALVAGTTTAVQAAETLRRNILDMTTVNTGVGHG